ncbi:MAG TPA: MBL fold metallo-hydrolase, partial [Bacteroidales bacterium]|nr:MBL fold metallo-hydrolase [Bacteroidales bacterium]
HDQQTLVKMDDIGYTEHFEMIPLIDWFTSDETLTGEAGVSYLIKTDESTILFDVGLNAKNEHPSPLLRNMDKLGIKMGDIDIIVISHDHGDHIGGDQWEKMHSFSLSGHQSDLGQKKVYTPVEMTYPGLNPVHAPKPVQLAKGVATTGVIYNPVFFMDIGEQALAVKVKDKGMVIISGCGHQTLEKILQRTEVLFDEPIYAVFGGFHYPLEEMRNITSIYKYVITGKLPWERLTVEDVENNVNLLKARGVKMAGLSGHDSCDKSISVFKKVFQDSYVDIAVGKKIVIN